MGLSLEGRAPFEDEVAGHGEDEDPSTAKAVMERFMGFSQLNLKNAAANSSAAKAFTDANADWVKTYNEAINTARNKRLKAIDDANHVSETSYANAVNLWAIAVVGSEETLVIANAGIDASQNAAIAASESSILVSAAIEHAQAVEAFALENPDNPVAARDATEARAEATRETLRVGSGNASRGVRLVLRTSEYWTPRK